MRRTQTVFRRDLICAGVREIPTALTVWGSSLLAARSAVVRLLVWIKPRVAWYTCALTRKLRFVVSKSYFPLLIKIMTRLSERDSREPLCEAGRAFQLRTGVLRAHNYLGAEAISV